MVDSNNAINDTVGASITGVTNTFTVTNPSDTASSAARETITVGGTSAGDPTLNWNVSGTTDWEMGIDNNDSDKWKLSQGTALGTDDTIIAFTTGEVLKPRTPAFFAYVDATISNVTGDGTAYTVIFDQEEQDIGSNFDVTTGLFTAPVAGTYWMGACVNMEGLGAANNSLIADFVTSGGTLYHGSVNGAGPLRDVNTGLTALVTGAIPLSAGETIGVRFLVQGGAKVVDVVGSVKFPGFRTTHFSGFLLG